MSEGYELGEEFPPVGRRCSNFIGYVQREKRDREGWVWYSFEEEEEKE